MSRTRTPTILQMEAVECGAAALAIVLAHHGRWIPLARLRQECGVSRDGSKASSIVKAARRHGMIAKGWKKEIPELRALAAPFIAFWGFNHFLVVEGFANDGVFLNDPATGPRKASLEELEESFTGVVLTFEKGPEFRAEGSPPRVGGAIARRLRGFQGVLAFAVVASALLLAPGLLAPAFTKIFVDQVLVEHMDHWLEPLLLGMAATAIVKVFLTWLELGALRRLSVGLATVLSGSFVWHVLRLPTEFYAQRYAGEIATRVRLNDGVAAMLSDRLARVVIDLLLVALYGAVMFAYDRLLCGIVVGSSLLNLVALSIVSRRREDAQLQLAQELGKAEGASIAGLQRIETIKASAHEESFFRRWAGYATKGVNAQQELGVSAILLGAVPSLLTALSQAALLGVGGLRVMEGRLTLGDLVAFSSLMQSFSAPVLLLVDLGGTIQELKADLARLDDVLHNPLDPGIASSPERAAESAPRLSGRLELRDVTFGYSRVDEPLIEGFDLKVEPGQRIAFVGGSGSGKSTVAKLVAGLFQPWSGEILFDGRPAREIPREVLAASLAMVEQDVLVFGGSLRENLTLWDSTVPHASLVRACDDAALGETIRHLPGRFDGALLEGGSNLSGGQRQRIEIARALVYDPAILILDEATSALDTETERHVEERLRHRGCTCLVIAHRLSTVKDCDQIVVFKEREVVQRGTHAELLADREGEYAALVHAEGETVEARS